MPFFGRPQTVKVHMHFGNVADPCGVCRVICAQSMSCGVCHVVGAQSMCWAAACCRGSADPGNAGLCAAHITYGRSTLAAPPGASLCTRSSLIEQLPTCIQSDPHGAGRGARPPVRHLGRSRPGSRSTWLANDAPLLCRRARCCHFIRSQRNTCCSEAAKVCAKVGRSIQHLSVAGVLPTLDEVQTLGHNLPGTLILEHSGHKSERLHSPLMQAQLSILLKVLHPA